MVTQADLHNLDMSLLTLLSAHPRTRHKIALDLKEAGLMADLRRHVEDKVDFESRGL